MLVRCCDVNVVVCGVVVVDLYIVISCDVGVRDVVVGYVVGVVGVASADSARCCGVGDVVDVDGDAVGVASVVVVIVVREVCCCCVLLFIMLALLLVLLL